MPLGKRSMRRHTPIGLIELRSIPAAAQLRYQIDAGNQALALDAKQADVLFNRGYAWAKKKEYEKAIADFRRGRMVILVDDEERENEGDLCIAAEKVTPRRDSPAASSRMRLQPVAWTSASIIA